MTKQKTYGTFTKKGQEPRTAGSTGAAVALVYDGWTEQDETDTDAKVTASGTTPDTSGGTGTKTSRPGPA